MKRIASLLLGLAMAAAALSGCGAQGRETAAQEFPDAVSIGLSDDGIIVEGKAVSTDGSAAVHTAHDIVCYESGRDFTYGEGTEADEHTAEEAEAHTVVHITQPGTYALSGTLSAGQIAVDLGEDAEDDPAAVVTLILNGVDITCTVAPAVIFYNVYECGSTDEDTASETVDTSAAGANVLIADQQRHRLLCGPDLPPGQRGAQRGRNDRGGQREAPQIRRRILLQDVHECGRG